MVFYFTQNYIRTYYYYGPQAALICLSVMNLRDRKWDGMAGKWIGKISVGDRKVNQLGLSSSKVDLEMWEWIEGARYRNIDLNLKSNHLPPVRLISRSDYSTIFLFYQSMEMNLSINLS